MLVAVGRSMDEPGSHEDDADRWCYVPFFASPRLATMMVLSLV